MIKHLIAPAAKRKGATGLQANLNLCGPLTDIIRQTQIDEHKCMNVDDLFK